MPGKEEIYMLYVLDYYDEQIVSDIRNYGDFLQSKGCELLFNPAIEENPHNSEYQIQSAHRNNQEHTT